VEYFGAIILLFILFSLVGSLLKDEEFKIMEE